MKDISKDACYDRLKVILAELRELEADTFDVWHDLEVDRITQAIYQLEFIGL